MEAKYGGLEANGDRLLQEFERENARLKRRVPDLMLDNQAWSERRPVPTTQRIAVRACGRASD